MKAELQVAADAASALLPFYNKLFNVPYPLEKLDLVGDPPSSISWCF